MTLREALEAAIEDGIAAHVRNTRAPVSQSDLLTDILAEVDAVLAVASCGELPVGPAASERNDRPRRGSPARPGAGE